MNPAVTLNRFAVSSLRSSAPPLSPSAPPAPSSARRRSPSTLFRGLCRVVTKYRSVLTTDGESALRGDVERAAVCQPELFGGIVIVARGLAPKLHARMLAACEGMFEHMPEDFPPKRMMGGIDEIRANTARILDLLEERTQAQEAKSQEGPPRPTAEEVETVPA